MEIELPALSAKTTEHFSREGPAMTKTLPDVHTRAEVIAEALPFMQRYDQEV
ncbi:MAG: hypothetical protein IOC43_10560, partial [Methylobacterium sp.]|nr:hypothetical protein [Methylobacterium sp.]